MDSKENTEMMHKAGAAKGGMNNESSSVLAQAGVRAEPAGIPAELTPMLLLNAALCIEGEGTPEKRQAIIEKLGRIAEAMHTAPTIPAQVPAVIREAIEATFEQRPGYLTKVGAAVRALGDSGYAQVPAAEGRAQALEEPAMYLSDDEMDAAHDAIDIAQSSTADKASEVRADDSRYPYTYAADYLRMQIGDDYGKGLISRSAASQARTLVAKAIGLADAHVANKLADAYLAAAPSTADSGNTGALGEGADRG